jgi:hypothetical protein
MSLHGKDGRHRKQDKKTGDALPRAVDKPAAEAISARAARPAVLPGPSPREKR